MRETDRDLRERRAEGRQKRREEVATGQASDGEDREDGNPGGNSEDEATAEQREPADGVAEGKTPGATEAPPRRLGLVLGSLAAAAAAAVAARAVGGSGQTDARSGNNAREEVGDASAAEDGDDEVGSAEPTAERDAGESDRTATRQEDDTDRGDTADERSADDVTPSEDVGSGDASGEDAPAGGNGASGERETQPIEGHGDDTAAEETGSAPEGSAGGRSSESDENGGTEADTRPDARAEEERHGRASGRERDEHAGGRQPSGGARVARRAKEQLAELTGHEAELVSSLERRDDSWHVQVEVVELTRVPSSTDVLASYEMSLDDEGELLEYRRTRRYSRNQTDMGM